MLAMPGELGAMAGRTGADLTATDEYGATPLHNWAHCWTQNVDVLLKLGADVNAVSRHRGTALHSAAKSHKPENVRKLIQWGHRSMS